MGTLKYDAEVEGQPSNVGNSVDDFFDDLAVESADINKENTRTEWVSKDHIGWESKPIISAWEHNDNSAGISTSYAGGPVVFTDISHGNNGSTSTTGFSHPFEIGDVLKADFNIVAAPIVNLIDPNNVDDYWWMKIEFQYDIGAGPLWQTVGYITRNSSTGTRSTFGTPYPICGYRRYAISMIEILNFPGTWTGMRVQIKSESAAIPLVFRNWMFDMKLVVN